MRRITPVASLIAAVLALSVGLVACALVVSSLAPGAGPLGDVAFTVAMVAFGLALGSASKFCE